MELIHGWNQVLLISVIYNVALSETLLGEWSWGDLKHG
jgi:hypothetical protein